jgi:hypothetical protein
MQIPLLADFAKVPTLPVCEGFRHFSALQYFASDCCELATGALRRARLAISLAQAVELTRAARVNIGARKELDVQRKYLKVAG